MIYAELKLLKLNRTNKLKLFKDKTDEFFRWVKGTELVELDDIDVSEDPVRPELTLGWRITNSRKIYGLKYEDEIDNAKQNWDFNIDIKPSITSDQGRILIITDLKRK